MKKIIAILLVLLTLSGTMVACGNPNADNGPSNDALQSGAAVTITFWNPITGPDATYMQELVRDFNVAHEGQIYVKADAQAEANHYQRILTSFTDNSTADLCLVHKSRVPSFYRQNKLRDMTEVLDSQGIKAEDYVGDNWTSGEFDGKMYAMTYDVLPIVLFYNRLLIPEGYTEEDILSDDFTVDKMLEMMKAAYVDAPMASKKTYGMAFNYSFTEPMFMSFLVQQGGAAVSADAPTLPTFNNEKGYAAAEAVMSMPFATTDAGQKVSSESGADHLNTFAQGRALFTIDGIWSAPSTCNKTERVDAGVALLPRMSADAERSVVGDGHSFVMFNNGNTSSEKDAAIAVFIKYLIDNSGTWCQGGKVAARAEIAGDPEYQKLEWAYLSGKLENIISPVKVYTYDTIVEPIGKYVALLCEGDEADVKKNIDKAASDARQSAEALG